MLLAHQNPNECGFSAVGVADKCGLTNLEMDYLVISQVN